MNESYINDKFFVISSDMDLSIIRSRIYGFCLYDNKFFSNIYMENDVDIAEDAIGAFTIVINKNDCIDIFSDRLGRSPLYYFSQYGYWAVSNSFYKLMLFLRNRVSLTLDEEQISLFLVDNNIVASQHERTLIREIKLLPIEKSFTVCKKDRSLYFVIRYQKIEKIKLNTVDGINLVDKWANKWINIIQQIYENGQCINLQVTGGYDSRVTAALCIAANIDFSRINIESSKNMKSDFAVSQQIADRFNFILNNNERILRNIKIDPQDVFNANILPSWRTSGISRTNK